MTIYAHDAATPWTNDARPSDLSRLKSIKRQGGIAVTVYIVGTPGGMRHANTRDVDAARTVGLGVLPNWERAADFFRGASLADCRAAGREALDACRHLGFPDDGTIGCAFSFDYQVPAAGYKHATDQLKACGDGMGGHYQPLGYGQIGLINYWAAHGIPGPHWLMGSTWRATSDFTEAEVNSPNVAMVQSHDAAGNWLSATVGGTDVNTVTQPDKLLAWWPDNSPYSTEDDMPFTEQQLRTIVHQEVAKFTYLDAKDTTAHRFVSLAKVATDPSERLLGALTKRVASLQAAVAELKAQQAAVQLEPVDVPVSGTVHIGGTQ